jgi:hypothetical protein
VLADEVNPLTRKAVRRVLVSERMAVEVGTRIGKPLAVFPNPERYGFMPTGPATELSLGRHVLGYKPSPFISASDKFFGARRFTGDSFWIDIDKAKANGATVHELDEIVADLNNMARNVKNPERLTRITQALKNATGDKELLLKGFVSPKAIKGAAAMGATRIAQGVQIVGFVIAAYDLEQAASKSIERQSVKPLAAETIRQAGGWSAAWAGMQLGAAGGAAIGFETGPGAVVFAVVGAAVGGTMGYFGADWVADHVDAN